MIRRTARGSLMSRCEGLLIQYILHESVSLLSLAWKSLLIWASIVAPLSKVFIPCSSLSLILTSPLLCGGYRPDETSNCEWLAAPANFPDGLFTNKAAGQTAHKDSPRRAPEILQKREGDLADEEALSLFFSSAHSLPPFPCRLIELSHASVERVPSWPQRVSVCVSVFLRETEGGRVWWKEWEM